MCHCRKLPACFELVIGCLLLIGLGQCEAVAADWKQRLLSEAPPKWAALEQYCSKVHLSYRTIFASTQGIPVPGEFEGTIYHEFRRNGDMIVATTHRVGSADGKRMDTIQVDGVNSRYAFRLGKPKPDAENYVVVNFETASDEMRRDLQFKGAANAYSGLGFRLSKIIEGPPFTIKDVQSVQRNGKELAQLRFDRVLGQGNDTEALHVTMILDPDRHWSVQECQFEDLDCKGEEVLEYGDDVDGFPVPRRSKFRQSSKKGYAGMVQTFELDKFVHREIPESEFTLSAFGLPEVQVPGEQKPRTLWYWLIGIGIALGAIAVLARRQAKKRQMQQRA